MMASKATRKKMNKEACNNCGHEAVNLRSCGRCKLVKYCGRTCQVAHWKTEHKRFCEESRKPTPSELDFSNDGKRDDCGVCLEMLEKYLVENLPCSHSFHAKCVDDIRSYGLTLSCPYCRAKLPEKTLKKTVNIVALLRKSRNDAAALNEIKQLAFDAISQPDMEVLRLLQKNGMNFNICVRVRSSNPS